MCPVLHLDLLALVNCAESDVPVKSLGFERLFDSGVGSVSFSSTTQFSGVPYYREDDLRPPRCQTRSQDVRILCPAVYFHINSASVKAEASLPDLFAADRTAKAQAITRTRTVRYRNPSLHATCKRTGAGVPAAFPGFRGETVASHCRLLRLSPLFTNACCKRRTTRVVCLGTTMAVEPGNPGLLERCVTSASIANSGQRYRGHRADD